MSTDRVTVTIPTDLRAAGQAEADERGTSFSAVVTHALAQHLRGRAIDAWLVEYEDEHGAFTEDELRAIAADAGVAYLPPPSLDPPASSAVPAATDPSRRPRASGGRR